MAGAYEIFIVSIESPIDRDKMIRVVDLILEYMEQMEDREGN